MNSTALSEDAHQTESQRRTQLELEKLALEVRDLRRATWKTLIVSLSTMVPILTMMYVNDKYEARTLKIENQKFILEQQVRDLDARRDPLNQQVSGLMAANDKLSRENSLLRDERDKANKDRDQLRTERDSASTELAALKRPSNVDLTSFQPNIAKLKLTAADLGLSTGKTKWPFSPDSRLIIQSKLKPTPTLAPSAESMRATFLRKLKFAGGS
jgi:uncharacterized protein YlxW (UPF0749 family)